jgi:hypothetical protein
MYILIYARLKKKARSQLTAIILVTWEAEIRRITVPGQPWQKKVSKTPSQWKKLGHGSPQLSF